VAPGRRFRVLGFSAVEFPAVLAQSPLVVKMQTSWPASDIWMDFAREYTTRVEEMSAAA
jgi:hypothetical protein